MPKTVRLSDEVYEQLRKESELNGISIAKVATRRLSKGGDAPTDKDSDAVVAKAFNKDGQPLEITLVDKRQDARIDQHEQYIKQLTAATISNRVGILEIAEDRADEIDSMMTGAYNKLMKLGMPDIAKEIKALSNAASDGELDEDDEDDLEYYEDVDEDE